MILAIVWPGVEYWHYIVVAHYYSKQGVMGLKLNKRNFVVVFIRKRI